MIKKVKRNEGCIGCGSCEQHCPEVFKISSDGESEVISHDYLNKNDDITRAEEACPVNVIEVIRETHTEQVAIHQADVLAVARLNDKTLQITLSCKADFSFVPGQFILLHLTDHKGDFTRAYSITHYENNSFKLCIAITEKSRSSQALKSLSQENKLQISAPLGEFKLHSFQSHKLFLATGTGIAPLIAMLQALPKETPKTLLWGVRQEQDLFFQAELQSIANLDLHVCLSQAGDDWNGLQGYISQHIPQFLRSNTEVYACGNPKMINQSREVINREDFPSHKFLVTFPDRALDKTS